MAREIALRESALISAIEMQLPEYASMCRDPGRTVVVMHQDAFAAAYQDEEYKLLGMAIKFAGICSKEVRIIGGNRLTLDGPIVRQ